MLLSLTFIYCHYILNYRSNTYWCGLMISHLHDNGNFSGSNTTIAPPRLAGVPVSFSIVAGQTTQSYFTILHNLSLPILTDKYHHWSWSKYSIGLQIFVMRRGTEMKKTNPRNNCWCEFKNETGSYQDLTGNEPCWKHKDTRLKIFF